MCFAIFYAFLFWGSNSLTHRRSCSFPLNWARYQIWTKATGEISVTALIFGFISRYAVLPRRGNYPGFVEGFWMFLREKGLQEYSNAFWDSVTIFFKCVDVRRDFYAFPFWGSNSLTNRRSCSALNWARYQIWTKATGEISVAPLIFGYISLCGASTLWQLSRFRRRLLNVLKRKGAPRIF